MDITDWDEKNQGGQRKAQPACPVEPYSGCVRADSQGSERWQVDLSDHIPQGDEGERTDFLSRFSVA